MNAFFFDFLYECGQLVNIDLLFRNHWSASLLKENEIESSRLESEICAVCIRWSISSNHFVISSLLPRKIFGFLMKSVTTTLLKSVITESNGKSSFNETFPVNLNSDTSPDTVVVPSTTFLLQLQTHECET